MPPRCIPGWLPVLGRVPLYFGTDMLNRHLKRIGRLAELKRFKKGAEVVREGGRGDSLYIILDGTATLTTKAGHEHKLQAGDHLRRARPAGRCPALGDHHGRRQRRDREDQAQRLPGPAQGRACHRGRPSHGDRASFRRGSGAGSCGSSWTSEGAGRLRRPAPFRQSTLGSVMAALIRVSAVRSSACS